MFAAAAAKRRRRRLTKGYLESLGVQVDPKTLRRMTRATQRRIPWYRSLAVVGPGSAFMFAWIWLFRGVARAGGAWWYLALQLIIYIVLPTLLVVIAMGWLMDRLRRPAMYRALRQEFSIPICTTCGYDLRGTGGLAAPCCPECGTTFQTARPD